MIDPDYFAVPPDAALGQGGQDAADPGGAGGPQLQQEAPGHGGQVVAGGVGGHEQVAPALGGQVAGEGEGLLHRLGGRELWMTSLWG
jgi:hypothetical protein